jgi:predicted ATP-grasp superfamily ATP-dependent carboligase
MADLQEQSRKQPTMTQTVIVMGCNTGGLAVIRSLGKRGLYIVAMTHNRNDIGTASKYVKEVVWCPDPDNEREFVDFLIKNAPRWNHPFVIECGDAYTKVLSRNKEGSRQLLHTGCARLGSCIHIPRKA